MWQCISYIAPTNQKKSWKAKDAIGTWCEVCEEMIPYDSQKNSKAVSRHMTRKHSDLLANFEKKQAKKRKQNGKMQDFYPKQVKRVKVATKADQQHFNKLVARWTACSLRPFSICEDEELQRLIDFATQVDGSLKLPSRNTNKARIDDLADDLRLKIRTLLSQKCLYYSSTSDLWSSRTMDAFMAFTLHFLCEDFTRYNFTLAIKPTVGKHTASMIQNYMQEILDEWGMPKYNLCMMLRDSGSNMVKACKDWGVPHFPCIGHSLHLVVGPFLLEKKKTTRDEEIEKEVDHDDDPSEDDPNEDDPYSDDFGVAYDNNSLENVRKIVFKLRTIVRYIKNSTKCKEIFTNPPSCGRM